MSHFSQIDAALEMAFGESKSKAKRMKHGRLVLVLEKVDGRVRDWWIDTNALTTRDVDRLMRERPHREVL